MGPLFSDPARSGPDSYIFNICLSPFTRLPVSLRAARAAKAKQPLATRRVPATEASIGGR